MEKVRGTYTVYSYILQKFRGTRTYTYLNITKSKGYKYPYISVLKLMICHPLTSSWDRNRGMLKKVQLLAFFPLISNYESIHEMCIFYLNILNISIFNYPTISIIIFIQFVWKQVIIHSLVSVMMYPSFWIAIY